MSYPVGPVAIPLPQYPSESVYDSPYASAPPAEAAPPPTYGGGYANVPPQVPSCYRQHYDSSAKTRYNEEKMLLSAYRIAQGILGKTSHEESSADRSHAPQQSGGFHFHYENRPSFFGYVGQQVHNHYHAAPVRAESPKEEEKRKKEAEADQAMKRGGVILVAAAAAAGYFYAQLGNADDDLRAVEASQRRMRDWTPANHYDTLRLKDIAEDLHIILEGEVKSRRVSLALAIAAFATGVLLFVGGYQRNFTAIRAGVYVGITTAAAVAFRTVFKFFRNSPYLEEAERISQYAQWLINNKTVTY
jgi:hypothetical protein